MESLNRKMGNYSFEILDTNNSKNNSKGRPSELFLIKSEPQNIVFIIEGKEMLRLSPDGFYVNGQKTKNDNKIYYAFKNWLEKAMDEIL